MANILLLTASFMSFNPSHGIAILRYCGIHVNIAGAHSSNTNIFTNWEEFYQWFQDYVTNHPDSRFHLILIGCGDAYNLDAPFRIEWFGAGVCPIEHRNTCTLSRWHYETNQYVVCRNQPRTDHPRYKATLDRLHFIYMNGTPDYHNAIAIFDIDAVFINPDGTAV
jgi:hypothetical protein